MAAPSGAGPTGYRKSTVREYFESICIAVILALFVRTFVVQAFKIPTGSMENNLLIGDHLLVNKFVFAPTLNSVERKLLPIDPVRRGDILVFKYPQDPERDFIKRVIGLPGETLDVSALPLVDEARSQEKIAQVSDRNLTGDSWDRNVGQGHGACDGKRKERKG